MKRLPLIINIVLLAAVAVLYFLHFTNLPEETPDLKPAVERVVSQQQGNEMAYVLLDSVIVNFDMFSEKIDELEQKQRQAERELQTKGQAYEREARDFQDKVSRQLVTRATAQEMEQNLMRRQQELIELRDRLQYELMEEEQVMNRQIIDFITTYLESVKDDMEYRFVFAKTFGGPLLYGDGAVDITNVVIEGLNNRYRTGATDRR